MVEQNFRFAAPLADRFYVIEHGRIVEGFAAAELEAKMDMLHELLGVLNAPAIALAFEHTERAGR